MPSPLLACVGDIAWDVLARPRGDLVWGADVYGSVDLLPGGSAANVAVWARRLGSRVRLVGQIGDDRLGLLMRAHLEAEGVGDQVTIVPGGDTTRIGVLVRPDGEHAFITDHSHPLRLTAGDVPAGLLEGADAVFFNGYAVFMAGSATFISALLDEARRRGVLVAFDPSSASLIEHYGATRLLREVGPLDILLANEPEAEALSGGAATTVLERNARLVVVKRGGRGATAVVNGTTVSSPAESVEVVDTTGAGDAFDAAFLVEYHRTKDIASALAAANALGAAVAGALGAQNRR